MSRPFSSEYVMLLRNLGNTGLTVSNLGFGAGQIGNPETPEKEIETLLNTALDSGVTLFDTARGYGLSEERIGRYLSHHRQKIVLSTKVGYGIPGYSDWSYDCVRAGIDVALRNLHTEYIDIVHLHSCPLDTLRREDVVRALEEAVQNGKVRVAGYSGENEALKWAVESGRFRCVEHSLSLCDQRVIDSLLPQSTQKGIGVIAKRPVANVPWKYAQCPKGKYAEEYWWRWKTMDLDPRGLEWEELALRFAAYTSGVQSCVVGTRNPSHILRNVQILEKGPLPPDQYLEICEAFKRHDPGWWIGQV